MDFIYGAVGLTFLGWIILSFLLLILCVDTYSFRKGSGLINEFWVLGLAALLFCPWNMPFSSIFQTLTSWSLWRWILLYIAVGFPYAAFEFFWMLRNVKDDARESWEKFLGETCDWEVYEDGKDLEESGVKTVKIKVREALAKAQDVAKIPVGNRSTFDRHNLVEADTLLRCFTDRIDSPVFDFSYASLRENLGIKASTTVHTLPLLNRVRSWILYWPIHFGCLVIGDFLARITLRFTRFLVRITKNLVQATFQDLFKV